MVDISASVLAKLKMRSKEQKIQLQQLLDLFCQEEFVRKLSYSIYRDKLILKGGFLLYTISKFTTRPTMDADYLLKNYSNDIDSIKLLIDEIINTPTGNDFISLKVRNIENISEVKEYQLFSYNF